MRRRDFLGAIGGAVACPFAAQAQKRGTIRRIGALIAGPGTDELAKTIKSGFEQGLQKLGWTNGRNVRVDYRWAPDDVGLRRFAAELVELRPNVLLALGTPAVTAAKQAAGSTPIVFIAVVDPLGSGFVASFARPGGNVTGFVPEEPPLAGKWVELLKEVVPQTKKLAFLYDPETSPFAAAYLGHANAAASAHKIELTAAPVHNGAELDSVLAPFSGELTGG